MVTVVFGGLSWLQWCLVVCHGYSGVWWYVMVTVVFGGLSWLQWCLVVCHSYSGVWWYAMVTVVFGSMSWLQWCLVVCHGYSGIHHSYIHLIPFLLICKYTVILIYNIAETEVIYYRLHIWGP